MINYWCDDVLMNELQQKSQRGFDETGDSLTQIPKLIHFIWLGSELPSHCEAIISQCKKLHPDWEIRIWSDADVDSLPTFRNRKAFDSATNYGMKSDILRYEVLYYIGGVYADVDYEWLQPLDTIVSKCTFFVGFANTSVVEVNNGFIGSVPNLPLMLKIIDRVEENCRTVAIETHEAKNIQLMNSLMASFLTPEECKNLSAAQSGTGFNDTIKLTGPGMLTTVLAEYLPSAPFWNRSAEEPSSGFDRIVIFDKEVFSAVPNTINTALNDISDKAVAEREDIKRRYVTDKSVVVHWWQKSWFNKDN